MTLERWLEIATHGLAPAPAELRQEYMAAFADAQDAGEWPHDVLAGWGDPHRVGRELRRIHLTDREARALHPGYAPTLAGLGQALREDGAFIGGVLAAGMVEDGQVHLERWSIICVLLLPPLLRWLIVSRLGERVLWRVAVSWLLHRATVLGAALLWIVWERGLPARPLQADLTGWEVLIGTLCLSYAAYHLYRLPTSLRAATKLKGETA